MSKRCTIRAPCSASRRRCWRTATSPPTRSTRSWRAGGRTRCGCRRPRARTWPAARRPCSSACATPCAGSSGRPGSRRSGEGRPVNVEHILVRKGREVRTIEPDASLGDALRHQREERVGSLVVSGNGTDLLGILSDRDILDAIADRGTEALGERVGDAMTAKVLACSRDDGVSMIMALMTDRRIRHVPVVEKDGRLCGMISIGDVVKHRLDEIEGEADALREYVRSAM